MSEFDQRISQIQTKIEGLTSSLRDVESAVSEASREFEAMTRNAENINQVATSVMKLEKLVDRLEKSPFAARLKEQISSMNAELGKLDVQRLRAANTAIEAQAASMKALNQSQINLNANFRRTGEIVQTMIAGLGQLSAAANGIGTNLEGSVQRISSSIATMTPHVQGLQSIVASLNNLDSSKYNQVAAAIEAISKALGEVETKKAALDIKMPRTNALRGSGGGSGGPTPEARAFAEQHGIDLSQEQYQGRRVGVRELRKVVTPVPTEASKAIQAEAAQSQRVLDAIQDRKQKYLELHEKTQRIDKALAELAQIQKRTFDKYAAHFKLPENVRGEAFQAVVKGDTAKKYELSREHRGTFSSVMNAYEGGLAKETVSPDIRGYETVSAGDVEKIRGLIKERANMVQRASDIKQALSSPKVGADISDLPNFKLDPSAFLGGMSAPIATVRDAGAETLDSLKAQMAETAQILAAKAETAVIEAAKEHLKSTQGRFGALDFALASYLGQQYQHEAPSPSKSPGKPRPGAVKYNAGTGQYFTGFENIEGQAPSDDQQADNLAAIHRALDMSPHGLIVVGTAAAAGGASRVAFGAAGKQDHSAVIHRNADRKLEVYELRPSDQMTADNETGTPYFGSKPGDPFDVEELAKAGRIDAIPLGVEVSEVQADTFLDALRRRAATGTYSFLGNGDTCATYVAGAMADSGIADQGFGDTIGGLNLLRPEDVTSTVAKNRQKYFSQQDPLSARSDLENISDVTREEVQKYEELVQLRIKAIKSLMQVDEEAKRTITNAASDQKLTQHEVIESIARDAYHGESLDDNPLPDRIGFSQSGYSFNDTDVSNSSLRRQQYLKETLEAQEQKAANHLASVEANQSTLYKTGVALKGSSNESVAEFGSQLMQAEGKLKESLTRFGDMFDQFSTAGLQKLSNAILAATASFEALLSFLRAKIPGFNTAYNAVSGVAENVGGKISGGLQQVGMFANDATAGVQFHAAMAQEALSTTIDATVAQQITGVVTPGSAQTSMQSLRERVNAFFQRFSGAISGYIERFSDWLSTFVKGRQVEQPGAMANASLLPSIDDAATSFSRNIYRPASYGFSQIGALLNSVRSVAKGAQTGGIGGGLDIAGGLLKGVNTVSNAHAYFGLNLLPKGFGETFSNSRSQTMMDLIETVTGLGTGYGRSPEQKQLRSLRGEERAKEHYIKGIQFAQQNPGSEAHAKQLENEFEKARKELAELRKTIRAYQEVLKDQAEKEIRTDSYKSTGAKLDVNARLLNVDRETTLSTIQNQLSESDKVLSTQAQAALSRFSKGTGLEALSGTALVSQNLRPLVQTAYNDQNIPQGDMQGINIPVYADDERTKASSVSLVKAGAQDAAQTFVHEFVHELSEQQARAGKSGVIYRDPNQNDAAVFGSAELQQAAWMRKAQLAGADKNAALDLVESTANLQGEPRNMAKAVATDSAFRNYMFNPAEITAHIGEALISGNSDLEETLRKIYGPELFEKVHQELAAKLPETFADAPLKALKSRFGQLDKELSGTTQQLGQVGFMDNIQMFVQRLMTAFSESLGPLGNQVSQLIQDFFSNLGISRGIQDPSLQANARMTPGGVDSSEYIDKYFNEFIELMAPRNVQHLVGALTKDRGITQVASDAAAAAADPAGTAQRGITKLQNLNVRELANNYASRIIKDIEFPLGLVGKAIQNSGLPDKVFEKITASVEGVVIGKSTASPLLQRSVQELLRVGIESQIPTEVSFRDELNSFVRGKTGKNIQAGSYQQSAQLNPATGMTEFALSARTAEGAMVTLNGHLDEFGRKKLDNPAKQMSSLTGFMKEFVSAIPRELGYQATYSVVNAIQSAFSQILGIQDELNEVVNAYGVGQGTGEASKIKYNFLRDSVQTAQQTGQGFDEAVQTNLKNFKILGSVQDEEQRGNLSNQLSKVQLGAQTAFGITLEQSLEAIPAVLTSISDGLEGVEDPVERTTQSITLLQEVMDKMVVAQRSSGASGEEMITVFSRLAASAKEYGLTQQELIALTATSAVSIGKGSDETSNVLRTLLEGTYSPEKQGALRELGITTKVFNPTTNKIQNRDFNAIMEELTKFISDPETKDRAPELFQVFGGPKLAPDIGKVIRGYSSNYGRVNETIDQQYTGNNFDELVGQKSQNLQGSLKKLAASATEMFNTFLVGTGAMDEASKFLDRLADTASRLTEFFGESGGALKEFFSFLMSMLKYNLIGELSKNVNIFSPLAKGFGTVKVGVSSAISSLIDFGKEGESSSNRMLRGFKLLGTVFNDLEKEIRGANSAIKTVGTTAATTAKTVSVATQQTNLSNPRPGASPAFMQASMFDETGRVKSQTYTQQNMFGDDGSSTPNARLAAAGGRGINPGLLGFLGNTFNRVSTATPAFGGLSSWWANNKNPMRNAAMTVGDNAGSMLAPMGFDLVTGGLNKSNVINTVGAGLAGTFLGSITASPQLGLVGYGMAKSFLDNIDFSKFFGASEKEMESFSSAVAEAIRKSNLTPEQQAIEEKSDEAIKQNDSAISRAARENFGQLDKVLGLRKFDENFTKFYNAQSIANRAQMATPFGGTASDDLERYQRLIVEKGTPQGNSLFGADSRFVRGYESGNSTQMITEQLYEALGSDQLRKTYIESNLTDPSKFLGMFSSLQEGKGDLLKNKDIRDILSQLVKGNGVTARTDGLATSDGGVVESLETSNDIIKRINENLMEFNVSAAKMRDTPLGITQYGEFGAQTTALDEKFAPQLEGIRSGKITGDEAKRIMEQYEKSRASLTSMPQSLQQIMPLAEDLGLNTRGLEQKLYGLGSEGQNQFVQRFGQAQQSNAFVQDYEGRQRALKQYESSDLYKAKDVAVLKEHAALQKALETDKARYNINKEYLALITSQKDVLLDQAGAIEKQNQTRQLISAGTPATFSPMSMFNTQGYSSTQINKAIQQALEKQAQLEKLSPGYKKYFGEQQFLMQGKGGFKPVTGVDQGFMQEALQSSQIQPPAMEDLSQFSDAQLEKILGRARSLQGQAIALNPDLEGKYDNERIMIYRKNNQLLQQTGLSQEYLKLAIQENTKSNETLRGHYNMPSSYRAPKVWDYYAEGGKETGDVNFPTQLGGQGSMVPLSFAQKLAEEMLKGGQGTEGADLSGITGGTGAPPVFYTGGSAPVWSDPVEPMPIPDRVRLTPKLPPGSDLEALRDMSTTAYQEQRREKELQRYSYSEPSRATREGGGKSPSTGNPLDMIKEAVDKTRQSLGLTDEKVKGLATGAAVATAAITGFSGLAATMALNTNSFSGAVTNLMAKIQAFDMANALRKANITVMVTVNGQTLPGTATVNNNTGGGPATLTGKSPSSTRF